VSAAHLSFRHFRNPPLKKTKKTTAFSNLEEQLCPAGDGSFQLLPFRPKSDFCSTKAVLSLISSSFFAI